MSLRQQFGEALGGVDRGAWVRFFIAIFGLALAFASALLSTASREAGDALATAVFASSALLLAGVVAVTTVPYLARRVVARRVRDALNYEVTREGLVYLFLTLLIGVAALNTGNNLLFIVVAAMLGAVLVSGIVSAVMISGLEIDLHLPHHVFAGQSYAGAVLLHNRRLLPAFSISVVPPRQKADRPAWRWQRTEFVYPPPRSGRKPIIRWPDFAYAKISPPRQSPPVFEQSVYFPFLPGRHRQSAELNLRFPRRGLYAQRGIGISTRFPFSFLTKTRIIALEQEVLVFPSVEPTDEMFEVLPMITGELETNQRGRGSDLYRIRDYEPEDSARHVDWKATAKSGELKVREYTREDERRSASSSIIPLPECSTPRITSAPSTWRLRSRGISSRRIPSSALPLQGFTRMRMCMVFSNISPWPRRSRPPGFSRTLAADGQYNIIVTACPRGQIPTPLWQSSWVLFAQE